jgi:hypothetical protein
VVGVDGAAGVPVDVVPCGSRMSVYFVPSAVFCSVTGLFTVSFSVGAPLAYEPPTIVMVAVVAVMDMAWKIGAAAGNAAPTETASDTPFTEITAEVTAAAGVAGDFGGVGGVGGVRGVTGVLPEPEPEPEPEEAFGDDLWDENGSLLSKSENDSSWPVAAVGFTAATSSGVGSEDAVAAPGTDVTGSVGTADAVGVPARVGAAVGVVVAAATGAAAASGLAPPAPFRDIIVFTA